MCWLFCVSLLFFTFATSDSTLLDKLSKIKWHCADENCSVPIAEGYGLRFYNGDDPLKLNFKQNDQFLILGKTNENKLDNYWLVQAGNRKGLVPVQFARERRIIINKVNQVVTELDLSSIIQPIETERTVKEPIKPSPPNLVVDGTTLPSYEDDTFNSEVLVEDDSEELYEQSIPLENSFFSDPSPVINDSPETDSNQKANETSEDFPSDKVASIVQNNVNINENSNSVSFDENSGIENSTDQITSGTEESQDFTNDKDVHVGSVNLDSNVQDITANETETNQATDVKVESSVNNFNNNIEENYDKKKVNDVKDENNGPESELTNTENVYKINEPHTTLAPPQLNEKYSANAVSESENSTHFEPILNTDAQVTSPPTETPKSESSDDIKVEEGLLTSQLEIGADVDNHSVSVEPNLQTTSETETSAKEDATSHQKGSGIDTFIPSSEEQIMQSMVVPPPEKDDLSVPLPHFSGSLPSGNDQSFGNIPSNAEVPPTETPIAQHASDFYSGTVKPDISSEPLPSLISASSTPGSDPMPKYDSPDISNTYNYASNNMDYNHKDGVESFPSADISNPVLDKTVEDRPVSDSEPSIIDQHVPNQPYPEEVVTETLPVDSIQKGNDGEDNSAFKPQTDELTDIIPEGDGWFSSISSIMGSFTEMFSKSDIGVEREDVITTSDDPVTFSEKSAIHQSVDDAKYCAKESCSEERKDDKVDDSENKDNAYIAEMFGSFSESQMSFSTLLCMIITSIVVLLFSLGYYYLENLKQDTSLVAKINTVSTELFFAQKELASIEEQYQLANENYQRLVSETSYNETAIEVLKKELEESKAARGALEDEIKRLEKEIESLVEEGDEMHRMLAESFSEEERTKSLLANISDLKSVLSDRLQEIVSLTEQLDKEKQEVELLTISLKKSEEKRESTEDKLTKVLIDADSKTLAVTKEFEEKITTLERIIEERSLERTNFEKQLCELKGNCESLMVEKELAEKELKKAHGVSSGKALSEWLEAKNIRADFLSVQKEVEKLSEALEEAKSRGTLLEEKEKQLLNEIEELNNKYESAEKDKIEALTKLQVLSNYFKEKEIQLQEELGIKESQWLQKQSEDHTIYEQMRSLREENLSYKAQNDALKKEIIDQEASFKIQIANEEQKAQENWINLRHTERRLKEVQMEAAHLRSRLTALEANPDSLEDKHKSLEMNGDVSMGAASPPFMLYPPPDFIPPPPLVSPTRPPPLGRLSSPPLTPPAPLSPFEYYPPPPPSPPPPLRVHKPQPREPHRKQKDSQSSNHSSESTEKPIRRGKR